MAIIISERFLITMHAVFADVVLTILGLVFATAGLGLGILIGYLISRKRKY